MAKIPRLHISSVAIDDMVANPDFAAAFPFLRNPPKASGGKSCKTCGDTPKSRQLSKSGGDLDYNAIKRMIWDMADERKRLLLDMLDTAEVKLCFRDSKGNMQHRVF
jgi:hypothetical protein